MPRVLHIMRMSGVSGSEHQLTELVRELGRLGWASDVLIPSPDPGAVRWFAEHLVANGASAATTVAMRRDLSPGLLRRLAALVRGGRYDIAHGHLVHADWHLALASLAAPGVTLVSTKHNHDPFRERRVVQVLEGLTMRRFAEVIAISGSLAEFTQRNSGVPATTVHYGLLPGDPPPERGGPVKRLLAVGRLEPQKGYEVLIEAVAQARAAGADVELQIAGEGSQRPLLERRITEEDLGAHVILLGQRRDVGDLMLAADAFVHSARWEGFGLVLLEAMRAGLPIVSTAVGAIPEVVADGETGLLVAPDDPAALGAAIIRLVREDGLASALGRAGAARLRSHFDPARMARETVAVYERALSRP
jgi:glycosyltransferase involved in cell wall biosynthesis